MEPELVQNRIIRQLRDEVHAQGRMDLVNVCNVALDRYSWLVEVEAMLEQERRVRPQLEMRITQLEYELEENRPRAEKPAEGK